VSARGNAITNQPHPSTGKRQNQGSHYLGTFSLQKGGQKKRKKDSTQKKEEKKRENHPWPKAEEHVEDER